MDNFDREYARLNKAQLQAVDQIDGPVLVVAGAGTGKTRVIVERIIHLIRNGTAPENILALTFTEKAAGEMLDRVSEASLGSALDTTIATYNGFGNDLLNQFGNEWGLGTVRLLGDTGQLVFLREHFDELELEYFAPISNPDGQLSNLRDYVSLLKQQLIRPDAYARYAGALPATDEAGAFEKKKHQELAHFYQTYLDLCRAHQVIDYDDQIYLSIELLKARPNVQRELQRKFRYILVDEFQDTNPMQSALIDLLARPSGSTDGLAGKTQNVMVVGDDDQSIYGWRGATLANILEFKQRYPAARDITLIENYRSTQKILDAAYRLIQHNNPERLEIINKLDKRLRAQSNDGQAPSCHHFHNLETELTWVADNIAQRLKSGQDPSTIAVLARRGLIVARVHETLELHSIAHAMAGLKNDLYAQPAVRQLLESLRAIGDPLDDMALFHVLSGPLFGLEQVTLSELAAAARREHVHLTDVIKTSDNESYRLAHETIEAWRASGAEKNVGDLAYAVITESGWKQRLYEQAETDPEVLVQVQALSKLFKTFKEFERISNVASVQSYLTSLPVLQAGDSGFEDATLDISNSLVNVLSVHRAKGLEWDTVYVVDCTEGSFPMRSRGGSLELPAELRAVTSQADAYMAEERRLMYVAVTRARREIILSYSDRHGNGALRRPSRFLNELLEMPATEVTSSEDQTSLELFAPRTPSAAVPLPAAIQQDGILLLTVSQIVCWLDCPQDFYYRYVLSMPLPADPSRQYGTAIHQAIQSIFDGRRAGHVPTLETLTAQVQAALPQSGYQSARSRERAHAQALQSVRAIHERFTKEMLPIEVEQSFSVNVPDLPLKIVGRLDAVYQRENGVEIRDFKTSSTVTTPEKAKSRATGSQQLTLYALAWQLMHDELPVLLTLDFVETGQIGSVRKQAKSLDTLHNKLATLVADLHAGHYPPGKDHTYCTHPFLAGKV
jgi:DNA helicase-2/ATP-dependent DNA helicase PcrA